MNDATGTKRITLSLAVFVLICFFLPWVQVGCLVAEDSVSGFELARETDHLLWFIPALMIVIILIGLAGTLSEKMPSIFALAGTVGGSISAYLMYYELSGLNDSPRLVAMRWTAFFWLGFIASLGIAVCAFVFYVRRSRSP